MNYPSHESHQSLDMLAKMIHETAEEKGWWDSERNFGEMMALIHSEVSEALEEHRIGAPPIYFRNGDRKPEGTAIELADVIIRTLDVLNSLDLGIYNIDDIIRIKMRYNETRPHKHGGKAY